MIHAIVLFICLILQSCGDLSGDNGGDTFETKYEKINNIKNHIKLISPSISNSLDPSTAHQYTYQLSNQRRLLVKLIGFDGIQADAIVNDENKAYVVIKLKNYNLGDENEISICPLTTNWAINATWEYYLRHRFSSRQWITPGGDYAVDSCLQGELKDGNSLYFTINDWILNYRNSITSNHGFLIKATKDLEIFGDAHPVNSPHFRWFTK